MIEEDFNNFLEEQLGKIVDREDLKKYCEFVRKDCEEFCPIKIICKKYNENSEWEKNMLEELKILQRKKKLEKLLK